MRTRALASLLPLLLLAACDAATTATPSVRSVRPTTLEQGEKLVVETGVPLKTGAPTRVVLDGAFEAPGGGSMDARLPCPNARATAPEGVTTSTRVLCDADAELRGMVRGRARFTGQVRVLQNGREVGSAPATLELFPPTLRDAAEAHVRSWSWMPSGLVYFLFLLAPAGLLVLLMPVFGGFITVWERKISGYTQSRYGPNRVGPQGWLQWLADGLKLIVKEDLVPGDSDPRLFRIAPYFVWMGVFGTVVVIPFSQMAIVADLDIGILFLLSVTALVVVGIIMGGWSSNSKWSLLGGMRSAAQIVSYELPASISVLTVVALAGTLSTQGLVRNQGGWPWQWHMFDDPLVFVCFFIYFLSALAEGNRTPFDLPEAESELVSGYNTEYSGFRFAVYALSEWANLFVIGAVATTIFLGGWNVPGYSAAEIEASGWLQLASLGVFAVKTIVMIFVVIWFRWTLPRFRVDQMMNLCWKYFLPITLVSLVLVAVWVWVAPAGTPAREIVRWATFLLGGVGLIGFFGYRVWYTSTHSKVLSLRGA